MLQRKQTLWLLCAAACAVLTMKFSFYSGHKLDAAKGAGIDMLTAVSTIPLLLIGVVLALGCLVNIFGYKNRKRQLWITIALIVVSLGNILVYWLAHNKYLDGTFSLSALFTLAIPLLLILAARGIMKDEKLVRSADRLR